jgi:PAS domain S-box-containing protein
MLEPSELCTPAPAGVPAVHQLDDLSAAAAVLDPEGRVIQANAAFADLLGRRHEALGGTPLRSILEARDAARLTDVLRSTRRGHSGVARITVRCRSDEKPSPVQLFLRKLGGGTDQIYVLAVDRTPAKDKMARLRRRLLEVEASLERQTAELKSALRARDEVCAACALIEEKVTAILRAMPVGVWVGCLRDGTCRDVNDAMLGLLGCSREQFVSGSIRIWKRAEDAERLYTTVRASGRVREQECECLRASGESFPALVWAERVEMQGESVVICAFMPHPERGSEEPGRGARFPRSSSTVELYEELVPSPERLHMQYMHEYLQRIVRAVEQAHGSYGVTVSVCAGDLVLEPQRATLIGLVVTELVTNAFQHAFPPGTGGRIEVSLQRVDDQYALRVSDSGVGMATAMPTEPTALGLRLVQMYVQRLHGRIQLAVSGGTHFSILFPRGGQPDRHAAEGETGGIQPPKGGPAGEGNERGRQ